MPIERSGSSGNLDWGSQEDYSRSSLLTISQQEHIRALYNIDYTSDQIAQSLGVQVDPRAVDDFLREQGLAMDQPEASSSRRQTRRDETPFFNPGSRYVDPGAPSPYPQSEPPALSDTRPPRIPLFRDRGKPGAGNRAAALIACSSCGFPRFINSMPGCAVSVR
jgi:hypothetical protein